MTSLSRSLAHRLIRLFPPGLGQAMAFETRSWFGRLVARRMHVDRNATNYLDLGAGDDDLDGFHAVDFFTNPHAYGADLRYPLLIDDGVFDGIFTEHTLEHLNYAEVAKVLAECRRILKPGGRLRVIVPDLSIFAGRYVAGDGGWFGEWEKEVLEPRGRALATPMQALSFVTQEYGHRSAWDFATMRHFLAEAGFVEIRQCGLREGGDPRLLRDRTDRDRTLVSLYVEACRPPLARVPQQGSAA